VFPDAGRDYKETDGEDDGEDGQQHGRFGVIYLR
jgi:hypothetical protein